MYSPTIKIAKEVVLVLEHFLAPFSDIKHIWVEDCGISSKWIVEEKKGLIVLVISFLQINDSFESRIVDELVTVESKQTIVVSYVYKSIDCVRGSYLVTKI